MSLTQRCLTEIPYLVNNNYPVNNDSKLITWLMNDIATCKQQDVDEKRYFHELNNRFENIFHYLDNLQLDNKKKCDELQLLINTCAFYGEEYVEFLQELNKLTKNLLEENSKKIVTEIEIKIFDMQVKLVNRVQNIYLDVINAYSHKYQILCDSIRQLEKDLNKLQSQLDITDKEIQCCNDDYRHELTRFRSYLLEWIEIISDKQNLLDEIQSLKKYYELRLHYNEEEINQWNDMINRISLESRNFYLESLKAMKQQLQIDYEQMLKEQQMDIEIEFARQFNQMQARFHRNVAIHVDDERQHCEQIQHYDNCLCELTKSYNSLESEYQRLTEDIQNKRSILQDLENQAITNAQAYAEQHAYIEHDIDLVRTEYHELKDDLDQLAYTIRFDIEEELKIYETLLNSLCRQNEDYLHSYESMGCQPLKSPIKKINNIDCSRKNQISIKSNDKLSSALNQIMHHNLYESQQNILDQCGKMTVSTTQTSLHDTNNDCQQINMNLSRNEYNRIELDNNFMQCIIRCKRKYKGNIRIKFTDSQGFFIEIENIGNHPYDLTGWYIVRIVDGRRLDYTLPFLQLESQKTVRIYGYCYYESSSLFIDDSDLQLIASNLYDWETGQHMSTELFNSNNILKALFEQTVDS